MLHLLVLIFACAVSIIHAADNPESGFLTYETHQISAANPKHPAPRILNTIDLSQIEPHTKKTFGELFKKAQEQNVPWAILSCLIHDPANNATNFTIDQFDLIELVRAHGYHNKHNCRSTAAVTKTINESLERYRRSLKIQTLYSTYNICTFIPQSDKNIPTADFSVNLGAIRQMSHVGALLGVALYKDNVNAALFLNCVKDAIKKNDFTGKTPAEKDVLKAHCIVIEQFWDDYFAVMSPEQYDSIKLDAELYRINLYPSLVWN